MINVVPYTNRKLTVKNRQKILELFPNEPVTIIEESTINHKKIKWAEHIARLFHIHGTDTSYEVNSVLDYNHLKKLAQIGCRLIFIWHGMKTKNFLGSFNVINVALSLHQTYPNVPITIRYQNVLCGKEKYDLMNGYSSIEYLLTIARDYKGVAVEFAYPTPWGGRGAKAFIKGCLDYIQERDLNHVIKLVSCGNVTILPNTNIYPCQHLPRRKRKQFFGNADRDKNVIGTLRRGLFRTIDIGQCTYCKKHIHKK